MTKKHWIYIKRGLSEDPKHRANMGECIWLFMHIVDRADWETGIVYDWKDAQESADMGMPVDTLRRQRQKLMDAGYIQCEQKQHGQNITIYEWKNPRDYSAEIRNPKNQGMHECLPLETQGDNQGLNEGLNQVPIQVKTPTYSSKSKSSPDTFPKGIEAAIAMGRPVTEEDLLAHVNQEEDTLCKIDKALHINCPRKPDWQSLAKWVQKQSNPGLDQWLAWYREDSFRMKTAGLLTPEKIRMMWPQAQQSSNTMADELKRRGIPEWKGGG